MNNITKLLLSVAAVSTLSGCIGQSESPALVLKKVFCVWGLGQLWKPLTIMTTSSI